MSNTFYQNNTSAGMTDREIMEAIANGMVELKGSVRELQEATYEMQGSANRLNRTMEEGAKAQARALQMKNSLVSHNATTERMFELCQAISWGTVNIINSQKEVQ